MNVDCRLPEWKECATESLVLSFLALITSLSKSSLTWLRTELFLLYLKSVSPPRCVFSVRDSPSNPYSAGTANGSPPRSYETRMTTREWHHCQVCQGPLYSGGEQPGLCFPHVLVRLLLCLCLVCFSAEPTFALCAASAMSMFPAAGSKRPYKPAGLGDPRTPSHAAVPFWAGGFARQGGLGNGLCRKVWWPWCLSSWMVEFKWVTEVAAPSRTKTRWDSRWRIAVVRTDHVASVLAIYC